MWVLLDNYDSFTFILHHYLLQTNHECRVFSNDEISVKALKRLQPERIIISPGPGTPVQAGICMEVINAFHASVPILGICLGHQALGMYFGAELIHAPYPMHGKTSEVFHNAHPVFSGLENPFTAMRYHSLSVQNFESTGLKSIAHTVSDQQIMALTHEKFPCIGLQFHPESVGTPDGQRILQNWADMEFYSHFH